MLPRRRTRTPSPPLPLGWTLSIPCCSKRPPIRTGQRLWTCLWNTPRACGGRWSSVSSLGSWKPPHNCWLCVFCLGWFTCTHCRRLLLLPVRVGGSRGLNTLEKLASFLLLLTLYIMIYFSFSLDNCAILCNSLTQRFLSQSYSSAVSPTRICIQTNNHLYMYSLLHLLLHHLPSTRPEHKHLSQDHNIQEEAGDLRSPH